MKPSWTGPEYLPYVRIAERFIRSALGELQAPNGAHPINLTSAQISHVLATVESYKGILERAGPGLVRDLPAAPKARAKAVLARLRGKYVDALLDEDDTHLRAKVKRTISAHELAVRVASWVVGLQLTNSFDPNPVSAPEFLAVQIGKAIHRLAGGHHRVFPMGSTGRALLEVNKYDHSRGRAVAVLGQMLLERDFIWEHHKAVLRGLATEAMAGAPAVLDWQAGGRTKGPAPTKGGRRRKPFKAWPETGHNRLLLGGRST